MDVNKNSYTFGFAAVMVIIVAALLSISAISLKPYQDRNIELEKQQNILSSAGINVEREFAEDTYSQYIKEELVLNYKGEEIDGVAFEIDLKKELKKGVNEFSIIVKFIMLLINLQLWRLNNVIKCKK